MIPFGQVKPSYIAKNKCLKVTETYVKHQQANEMYLEGLATMLKGHKAFIINSKASFKN